MTSVDATKVKRRPADILAPLRGVTVDEEKSLENWQIIPLSKEAIVVIEYEDYSNA